MTPGDLSDRLRARVREIPDFPKPGISFKDITPVLADQPLFQEVVAAMRSNFANAGIDKVVGIESRGFIFGAPLALWLGCGFVPVRKPGKLPHECVRIEYELEYGTDALEAHVDAIQPGERVLIVDDLLATGGTAAATARLVEKVGGEVAAAAFVIELGFLAGRDKLGVPVHSLLTYS